ncbi:MAG: hypothetical protein PWR14_791 [Thermosediminibacterales bacterium]|nr:hypothetical protein [Thermosediminibacterales bacterium]
MCCSEAASLTRAAAAKGVALEINASHLLIIYLQV